MKCCKILQSKLSTEHAFTFHYKNTCETETGEFLWTMCCCCRYLMFPIMREWDNWGKKSWKNKMLILNYNI